MSRRWRYRACLNAGPYLEATDVAEALSNAWRAREVELGLGGGETAM
jgi:hypothetical protein